MNWFASSRHGAALAAALALVWLSIGGCGSSTQVAVSVTPPIANVAPGAQKLFTATVTGTSNKAVTWSCTTGGSIDQTGLLTVSATARQQLARQAVSSITVTATSQADTSKFGVATVTVTQPTITVAITSPTSGATLSGTQTVTATLSSLAAVTGVVFAVNGTTFATVPVSAIVVPAPGNVATVSAQLNTVTATNGSASISVTPTGNGSATSVTVTINNPRTLYVANATGAAGVTDAVTVKVMLNQVTTATGGVAGFSTTLTWDPTKLTLDINSPNQPVPGADLPAGATLTLNTATPGKLTALYTGTQPFTSTSGGQVMTAKFTIDAPSVSQTANVITMTSASLTDVAGNAVTPVATGNGTVTTQ